MPPWEYEKVKREARFHLQVAIEAVERPVQTPAQVRVVARVVRAFRGELAIVLGQSVDFYVDVMKKGDEGPPDGDGPWIDYDELSKATHMEVFLNGEPPTCHVPFSQCVIIESPSADPYIGLVPDGENPLAWIRT